MSGTEPNELQDVASPPPFLFYAFIIANIAVASCFWLPWILLSFLSPGGWILYVMVFVSTHVLVCVRVLIHFRIFLKCVLPAIVILALLLCWHTYHPDGNYIETFTPPMQSSPHTQWGYFGYARATESGNASAVEWSFDFAQFLIHVEYANDLVLLYAFVLGLKSDTWRAVRV